MGDRAMEGSTDVHAGPHRPEGPAGRPALICAFPRPAALRLPDSGQAVGRSWLADHGLADTEVSGAHLRFDRAGGGIRVVDVGSRNGTWVNGTPIARSAPVTVEDGAVLRLGRTLLVVRTALRGPLEPAAPIGRLVGPYGLRELSRAFEGLVRQRPTTVLIEGETGTGKELTARALAEALGRDEPYSAVNVAGVAEGVFESQLFGHTRGAFSGASTGAAGLVPSHDGGTVFLDEIGELPADLQPKLLRLIDNREVLPVGADRPMSVDVLLLAATHRDLEAMVEQGRFRSDLHARLAEARIVLPPLRRRPEDLFAIAAALARSAGRSLESEQVEVEAVERLLLEPWPQNVRELSRVLAEADRADPEPGLRLWALERVMGAADHAPVLTEDTVEAALAATDGNVTQAAKRLGISRGKLLRFRKRSG